MDTDEARAERLAEELCHIPVGKLGGVVCILENLIQKIGKMTQAERQSR